MQMQPVDSEAISSIGYDSHTLTMRVKWKNGGTYDYHGVLPTKHQALMAAPSIGKHFHQHIRPHHVGVRV